MEQILKMQLLKNLITNIPPQRIDLLIEKVVTRQLDIYTAVENLIDAN